ncbi:hypothetical protein KKB99_00960, partial [bacterium]|nr:hypothetical protein [bacterium]MBU1024555.1 hypothetical protein [bacterium]
LEKLIYFKFKPSLSSLSVTSVKQELLELLVKGGMNSLTLGVETFDNEVQKRVGKIVTAKKLSECFELAFGMGMKSIKLYLMLGLPGAESDEENLIIEEVTNLHKLAQTQKPGSRITISLNPFIPKIATLFKRERFMGEKSFRRKMGVIRKKCAKIGVKVKSESHRDSLIQYLLSCGDESMSTIIEMLALKKNFSEIRNTLPDDLESYMSSSIEKVDKLILR